MTTVASIHSQIEVATAQEGLLREPPGGASSASEPEQASSGDSASGLLEQQTPQTSLYETQKLALFVALCMR